MIRSRLANSSQAILAIYGGLVAFALYSCMYAYRKTFTVASFESIEFAGIGYKSALIIAQVLGYTISKFIGIRFISSHSSQNRGLYILGFILFSWLPLLFLPLLPPSLGILCLFLNGLPLGMIWGLVFSYLEGRRTTEIMGAMLSCSFIFSSGLVKSVGKWLMTTTGVTELWMPFVVGAIFILPLLLLIYLIEQFPRPTATDEIKRCKRVAMNAADRNTFFLFFLPGIILLTIAYISLTVIRDVRDAFSAEIWAENGYGSSAAIFTSTEIPATIILLILMGLLFLVRSNRLAIRLQLIVISIGLIGSVGCSLLFKNGMINITTWMISLGIFMYMSYIPFNSMLFDRLIAAFKIRGNSGFGIYIIDSFGYLASMAILIYKEFSTVDLNWTTFLLNISIWIGSAGMIMMIVANLYFSQKLKKALSWGKTKQLLSEPVL